MSDTDTVVSGDHPQQNRKESGKQITFSQADFDDVTASVMFTEQEQMFIDNLNVDAEAKQVNVNEPDVKTEEPTKTLNIDDVKMYVLKCVSRQDICPSFAAMEHDFFDKVELCVDEMTENSLFRMEGFINTRLERVIMYSKAFSENICTKLTTEERELYIELCEAVSKFRKRMNERLKIDK